MTELNLSTVALDIQFNAAVMTMANKVCPVGWLVGDGCPKSYDELIERLDAGNMMFVFDGGSEKTIYGCPEVNYAFRAWHDWCHWKGRFDFSYAGEFAVYRMQCAHLNIVYGCSRQTRRWKRILYAETIGQFDYLRTHGEFPDDQRAFVEAYLTNPFSIHAE